MTDGSRLAIKLSRNLKALTVFLFIVFAVIACTTKSKRSGIVIADSKSYEASLFRQNCAVCHGPEANGKDMGGQIIPSLRYGDAEKKTEEEIYQQIKEGKLPMPAFKNQLSEKEIRQMVNFVMYDLQAREKPKAESSKE